MQINGLTNQITNITSSSSRTHHTTIEMPKQNTLSDSISISELGKRISMNRTSKINGGTAQVQNAAELMSKSLAGFEKTLERMNEITEKASKDDLTALDRINMQIEFEELREDLASASNELNKSLAKIAGHKSKRTFIGVDADETQSIGDNRKLLERARDRIMNGEDWNIAEHWQTIGETDENGEFKITGGEWVRDDSIDSPTVRDKIRNSGTVDLMSSLTAKKGIERVAQELADVKDMRERFSSFLMSYDGGDLGNGIKLADLPDEQRKNGFDTALGIMYEIDTDVYELSKPTNQMGYMFSRINDMFRDTAGKLAGGVIDEGANHENQSQLL